MQVKLKVEAGPVVIVAEGAQYYRELQRENEPFQIEEWEWPILERTALFQIVGTGLAPPAGTGK